MKPSPRILLYPLSLVYCLITSVRNTLYNKGIKKTTRYQIPLISIGNLTVGGTGKTPMSELLIKTLLPDYRCALLSRGYGRKTKGPRMAANDASPATIGDEPMQMKLKFPELTVMVAEKRTLGMEYLLQQNPAPQVVLLDDDDNIWINRVNAEWDGSIPITLLIKNNKKQFHGTTLNYQELKTLVESKL